jgi:hypothetical protein
MANQILNHSVNISGGSYHYGSKGQTVNVTGTQDNVNYTVANSQLSTLIERINLKPTNASITLSNGAHTYNIEPGVTDISGTVVGDGVQATFNFQNYNSDAYILRFSSGIIGGSSTFAFTNISGVLSKDIIILLNNTYTAFTVAQSSFKGLLLCNSGTDFGTSMVIGCSVSNFLSIDGKLFVTQSLTVSSSPELIIDGYSQCFAEGTKIETPSGPVKVEDLNVGDEVVTQGVIVKNDYLEPSNGIKKIVWTGNYPSTTTKIKNAPVRIQKGALGNELPTEDLYVSPNHGIVVDGKLIPARKLKNGSTIYHDQSRETIRYYHIQLEQHSALVAHGVLTESYLDVGKRDSMTSLPRGPINNSITS